MAEQTTSAGESVRAAEVVATLCLATDLGMGVPLEHGIRATHIAMQLCDVMGIDAEETSKTFYAGLLMYSGCTTDAERNAEIFVGGATANILPVQYGSYGERMSGVFGALVSPGATSYRRAFQVASRLRRAGEYQEPHFRAICEVAEMLAERLGLPKELSGMFRMMSERWDGKGVLKRAEGDEIPLPIRIVQVARDAAYQGLVGDMEHVAATIRDRSGRAFDPRVAEAFVENSREIMPEGESAGSGWADVLAGEPKPWRMLEGGAIDRALAAMGDFADLVSPYLSGHGAGVARLASSAGEVAGLSQVDVVRVRRAGYLHDLGRVAVDPGVWSQGASLSADQWEQVRLHPYYVERILAGSPFLSSLGEIAGAHHERLDGSGYHRGTSAAGLPKESRLLSAADAFRSMTEPRARREALNSEQAGAALVDCANRNLLDAEMVEAVLLAAGLPAPDLERPAGLTARESEVIGLLARGMQTKQVAHALGISTKTADHHVQSAYRKMGVSTRAAATLFAMENGLIR